VRTTKLLIINPVGHTTWDEQDKKIFESFDPNSEMTVVSLPKGPPSVETRQAHRQVIPLIIEVAKKMNRDFDALVVNCYLDPAVDALRKALTKPVMGPCEASLALASMVGTKIGVVTVHGEALSMIRNKVRQLDPHRKVKAITGIPMGVLDLNEDLDQTKQRVVEEVQRLRDNRRVDVICLGCTGLGGLAQLTQQAAGIPVIDPIGAAVELARAVVDLNLYSSSPTRSRQVAIAKT
jgi:allantoin racemase